MSGSWESAMVDPNRAIPKCGWRACRCCYPPDIATATREQAREQAPEQADRARGDWESAMVDEALRLGPAGTTREGLWERYTRRAAQGRRPLTSYSASQKRAFMGAIDLVTEALLGWETDPPADCVWELRRGEQSIFYPLFREDPTIWVECPSGRVHNPGARVTTDYRGECSVCSYDLVGGSLTTESENER